MNMAPGETMMLNCGSKDPVDLRCGGVPLTTGVLGRTGEQVAVRVNGPIRHKTRQLGFANRDAIPEAKEEAA